MLSVVRSGGAMAEGRVHRPNTHSLTKLER